MRRNYETYLRRFHEAKWDEEMIFDLSVPGQRGIVVPKAEAEIVEKIGKGSEKIPDRYEKKKTAESSRSTSDESKQTLYEADTGSSWSGYHTGLKPGNLYNEIQS